MFFYQTSEPPLDSPYYPNWSPYGVKFVDVLDVDERGSSLLEKVHPEYTKTRQALDSSIVIIECTRSEFDQLVFNSHTIRR